MAAIDEVREEVRCAGTGEGSARNDDGAGVLTGIAFYNVETPLYEVQQAWLCTPQ